MLTATSANSTKCQACSARERGEAELEGNIQEAYRTMMSEVDAPLAIAAINSKKMSIEL